MMERVVPPASSYTQPVLAWELFKDPARAGMLGVAGLLLLSFGEHTTWKRLDLGPHARLFVMAAAALLVWPFSTVHYNFFFDQGYILDRFLLVGLWALIYVHPLWSAPMLVLLSVMIGQLIYPLTAASWHWPDKRLPFDFLVMFCSFLALRPFFRQHRQAFILLTCTVVGSQYFHAGLNKLLLGPHIWTWATENRLSHIFVGSYLNGGWLRPLPASTILRWEKIISTVDPVLTVATLMVECGAILLLLHPRLLPRILIAAAGLHVGILALTGIFFWKWIAFDLMLALWLSQSWRADGLAGPGPTTSADREKPAATVRQWLTGRGLFSAPTFTLFVILVLVSKPFFRNVPFAWWDTPYINFFEIRGVGQSGTEYVLDSRFFAPYDMVIHQARFYYLDKHGVLGGTYAVAHNYEFARAVENAGPDEMEAIREKFGESPDRDAASASTDAFKLFVSRYVSNAARHGRTQSWLHWFTPPYHFQTWRPLNAYDLQEPLRKVYVQHLEFLDWHGEFRDVGSKRVLDIPLE
jgi:hypothetical protein